METIESTTLSTEDVEDVKAVRGPVHSSVQATTDTVEASPFLDVDDARIIYPPAPAGGSVIPLPIKHPFMYAPFSILPHGMAPPECIPWFSEESTALKETATMDNTIISNTWHVSPEHSHYESIRTPSPIDNALALMLTPLPGTVLLPIEDGIDAFLWQAAIFDAAPEVIIEEEQLTA